MLGPFGPFRTPGEYIGPAVERVGTVHDRAPAMGRRAGCAGARTCGKHRLPLLTAGSVEFMTTSRTVREGRSRWRGPSQAAGAPPRPGRCRRGPYEITSISVLRLPSAGSRNRRGRRRRSPYSGCRQSEKCHSNGGAAAPLPTALQEYSRTAREPPDRSWSRARPARGCGRR